ncbi:hypothetical protein [Salinimicrobium sp. GXAS 041]|uniref:hypothetical protein n=1 Tax=Salinimicrobium sp. GXAS 041 TaxID=3400806 RepID=UPI003C75E80D
MEHKGDAKAGVEVAVGTRSVVYADASGVNISGSYAVSDHIGVMGSTAFLGNKDEHTRGVDKYRLNNYEIGLGYINTRINQSFLFEIFAGGGYITQQHLYNYKVPDRTLKARSIKYFLQPNIAYKLELVSFSFSPKFVLVENKFVSHDFPFNSEYYGSFYSVYQMEQNTRTAYLEPTLDLTVGLRQIKLKLQGKYIGALEDFAPRHPKIMVSMGLQFELDELLFNGEKSENVRIDKK